MKVLGSNPNEDVIVQLTKGEADALNAVRGTMKGLYHPWKGLEDVKTEDAMEDAFHLMHKFAQARCYLGAFKQAVMQLEHEMLALEGRDE